MLFIKRNSNRSHYPGFEKSVVATISIIRSIAHIEKMICELPIDISVRILGGFLSLKGLVQLDSAICCINREKYLPLLHLVQISHKIDLSNAAQSWLGLRHIRVFSVNLLVDSVNVTMMLNALLQSLQHLTIDITKHPQPDQLLAHISHNCPMLHTLQVLCTQLICECEYNPDTFLKHCSRLQNFHVFQIDFPPTLWKDLCERHVSFLCVTQSRTFAREIAGTTGLLPEADIDVCNDRGGVSTLYCVWNSMAIPEVNKVISMFLPGKHVTAASYTYLSRGAHASMFGGTFRAIQLLQLYNCVDMDTQTFTAILQLPYVMSIDLHHNHTITGLAENVTTLGRCISVINLDDFSAFTNDAFKRIQRMLPTDPRISVNCKNMSQISNDVHNGVWIFGATGFGNVV